MVMIIFLTVLLEIDAEFVTGFIEQLLEAIFVNLLFSAVEAIVLMLTSLVGESFLGIMLTLILVGTGGMAVKRSLS